MRWEIIYKGTVFVAEEMGIELKRSALSPNIRERMDHSCAILDKEGKDKKKIKQKRNSIKKKMSE